MTNHNMFFFTFNLLKNFKIRRKIRKAFSPNDRNLLSLIYKMSLQTYNKIILF